jgi:alcohol dehydrogenase (cytochrome c)
MTKTINLAMTALAALAIASVLYATHAPVSAQGATSSADGVFTDAQAKRGEKAYSENCSFCHGDDLRGSDVIPALTGDGFVKSWTSKSVGDLFEKIQTTMPATAPGSLMPAQSADIVAHVLIKSGYPAGATELPTAVAALKQIQIVAPKR